MEIVSVKFQEDILSLIDRMIKKNNFNSRTEFIREAVRDKLNELSTEEIIAEFMKFNGASKTKTPIWMDGKIRKDVSKELEAYLDKKFKS